MSDRIVIEAEPREVARKGVGQLRREGLVPGVVYGKGEPQNIQLNEKLLRRALRVVGTSTLADLTIDGKSRPVLVKEIQQHLTRGNVLHVDFFEVDMAHQVRMEVELVTVGESVPEKNGLGNVLHNLRQVEIEALPDALVSSIDVDISKIATPDDVIHVRDLVLPKGITVLTDPDQVVARFEYTSTDVAEGGETGEAFETTAVDVEVIARGKQEDEDF